MARPKRTKQAAVPTGQLCPECHQVKPFSAFRWIKKGLRQTVCRRCRPTPPVPAWKARELATRKERRDAAAASRQRQWAKAREHLFVNVASAPPAEAPQP